MDSSVKNPIALLGVLIAILALILSGAKFWEEALVIKKMFESLSQFLNMENLFYNRKIILIGFIVFVGILITISGTGPSKKIGPIPKNYDK